MLPDAVEADLAKADRGDVRVEVVDEGKTRMHDIYVISAPVTGRVLRVEVEPGDEVRGRRNRRAHVAGGGWLPRHAQRSSGAGCGQCCGGAVALCRCRSCARRARASSQYRVGRGQSDFQGGGGSKRSATRRGACGSRCGQGRSRACAQCIDGSVANGKRPRECHEPERGAGAASSARERSRDCDRHADRRSRRSAARRGHRRVPVAGCREDEVRRDGADRELGRAAAARSRRSRRARRAHEDLGARRRRAAHERHPAVQRRPSDALQAHDFRVDVRVVVGEAKNAVRVPLGALFRQAARAGRSTKSSTAGRR